MYCLIFTLLLEAICLTDANVLSIFGKHHFYEIDIRRPDDVHAINFDQSFSYFVGGNGECAFSNERNKQFNFDEYTDDFEEDKIEDANGNHFRFKRNLMIYSDPEETLGFMIHVEFDSLNIPNIEGYEIVFNNSDNDYGNFSCVQLVPVKRELLNLKNEYKLRIKDPSFLYKTYQADHLFYFGKVFVRPLFFCSDNSIKINDKNLCARQDLKSKTYEIGIKKDNEINTSKIEADVCQGHVMAQTCIIKYSKNDPFYFIMYPSSKYFDVVLSDMDLTTLTAKQVSQKNKAAKLSSNGLTIDNYTYPPNISEGDFVHHIVSHNRQSQPNGLIIKFVKFTDNNQINYAGVLKQPTSINTCSHTPNKCPCSGAKDGCSDCNFDLSLVTYYVPVNYDENPLRLRSNPCYKHAFFKPYFDLDKIDMAFNFKKQNLSLFKKASDKYSEISIPRIESIPRVCVNINYGINPTLFDINVIFNDYYKTGISTVLLPQKYELKLYSYVFKNKPSYYQTSTNKLSIKFCEIDPKLLIQEKRLLDLTDTIQINNLKSGTYLMEFLPVQESLVCSSKCLVEGIYKNKVDCVSCNKLVVHFVLESGMLDHETLFTTNANDKNKNKISKINENIRLNKIYAERPIKINILRSHLLVKNEMIYKCSKDNSFISDKIIRNNDDIKFEKHEIYSSILSNDINLKKLILPYIHVISNGTEIFQKFEFFSLSTILFVLILILLLLFIKPIKLFFMKCVKLPKFEIKKKVVFYLSIDVDRETQEKLGELIEKYMKILKKYYKKINFDKIDYSLTEIKRRNEIIDQADLIFYVCATPNEVYKLSEINKLDETKKFLAFGTSLNSFQHDYNKIHYLNSFEKKCFNCTFNNLVNPNEDDSTIYSENRNASFKPIAKFAEEKSILLPRFSYLKLPERNESLIELLISERNNNEYVEDNEHDSRKRGCCNKLISFLNNHLLKYSNHQIIKSLKKEAKSYSRLNSNNLFTLKVNQNICDENFFEIDEEFEEYSEDYQKSKSNQTSDSSSTSSFNSNIATIKHTGKC